MPNIEKQKNQNNISNIKNTKNHNSIKYISAKKIKSTKNLLLNEKSDKIQIKIKNKNLVENPFLNFDNHNTKLKRSRLSVPWIQGQINSNDEISHREIFDPHYESSIPSLRSTINKFHKNESVNYKSIDNKNKEKININKVYYSHSPSSRNQDGEITRNSFKNKCGKHNEHQMPRKREDSKLQIMQKRIVKAGSNIKKFPQDFF